MPSTSPFTIETPSNGLRLDAGRKGQASFTVFNASGRTQRVRAMLIADPPEARRWLTLEGEEYRSFPVAGAETYAVDIAVPPEGAPGNYTLRLDVQGEDDPDRSHVQGPTVTFEVPTPPPPPPPGFPWWIAAVVGVLVVAAIAFFILRPRTVLVPEVNGLPFPDGAEQLQAAGLEIVSPLSQGTSNSVPVLGIIRTDPVAGEQVSRGSEVEVVVSTGPAEIQCVRFPCEFPGDLEVFENQRIEEMLRVEPSEGGRVELFFDPEALRGDP